MITVDISNVWTCLSFGDLLGREKDVFDAHMTLCDHTQQGHDHMGWLQMPAGAVSRMAESISRTARKICESSEVLVVCGCGGAYHGAEAAIEAYCGTEHALLRKPAVLFVGRSLSARRWQDLGRLLHNREYSVLLISPDGKETATNVTARGLRWMTERRYGAAAADRIYVATMVGTPLHTMAQEEGYELFPMPKQPGGFSSTITSAALLPMTVAGLDPQAVLDGAVQGRTEMDIRSFENPAWLYAAAGNVLGEKGRNRELFCVTDPGMLALGQWRQRDLWRQGINRSVETVLLPGDLEAADKTAPASDSRVFETILRFADDTKKVPVEMDWKDYDGLGFLSGKHTDFVLDHLVQAVIGTHNNAGVPILDVDAGELTAENLGAMFVFFELSSAISAVMEGKNPFDSAQPSYREQALDAMR